MIFAEGSGRSSSLEHDHASERVLPDFIDKVCEKGIYNIPSRKLVPGHAASIGRGARSLAWYP